MTASFTVLSCLVALLFLVVPGSGQVFDWGQCDIHAFEPLLNFNPQRHAGRWYEIQRYFYLFEENKKCVEFNYTLQGNRVTLLKTSATTANDGQFVFRYTHTIPNMTEPARNSFLPGLQLPLTAYQVVDTDYTTYSVSWGCKDLGVIHFDYVWIISRTPTLPAGTLNRIHQMLLENDLQPSQLRNTNRENCPTQPLCVN